MTFLSGALPTFSAIGMREDLSDKIYNISPTDTPFMGAIDKAKASAVTHEWQTDSLASAAANAQLEGDTFAFSTPAVTTRLVNTTQISYKTVAVTGTLNAVNTAGRTKEMVYQLLKRSKELKRDMEFILLNNQAPVPQSSASTTTARALRPANGWYSTNTDRGTSGAAGSTSAAATDGTQRALTEDLLKTVVASAWNSGGSPSMALVGKFNKQAISAFAGNATRQIMANDRRLIAGIGYYEHDFGILKIVPDRFSRDRDCHIIDPAYWGLASLRPMTTDDLAKDSDATKGVVITEYTLECRNEAASGIIADLTTS